MKRILQALAAALAVSAPEAASALDGGLTLDRYPAVARGSNDTSIAPAVSGHARYERSTAEEYDRYTRGEAVRGGRHGSVHHVGDDLYRRGDQRWNEGSRYRRSGSVVDVSTYGGAIERGSYYGTAGTANSSVIVVGLPTDATALPSVRYGGLGGGPKILSVYTDRLDRQPYGKDGLAVAHVGTAKIIRIAPDFRRARDLPSAAEADENAPTPFAELPPEERAVTVFPDPEANERPVDPPASRRAAVAAPATGGAVEASTPAGAVLEPWSAEWLRDCVARHPNFDASLGTYTNEAGQRRFCTGEP
jgi:Ni/Co efflux regulator RcnB